MYKPVNVVYNENDDTDFVHNGTVVACVCEGADDDDNVIYTAMCGDTSLDMHENFGDAMDQVEEHLTHLGYDVLHTE